MKTRANLIGLATIVLVAVLGFIFLNMNTEEPAAPVVEPLPALEVIEELPQTSEQTIGTSVEGRTLKAVTFGTGETDLLFIGGIHGGYEANTVVLAEQMLVHLEANPELVPETLTIHIIPNMNPDGYALRADAVASDGEKRFNANGVDLNRNFDCRWKADGVWRGNPASGGTAPFSEPEAAAVRDYVQTINPSAVVVWHSKANNVYGSECGGEVAEATLTLMSTYAQAANYGEVPVFDAYVVTGAIEDWLASLAIPTISVELETRDDPEWERNLAATKAVFELYR